MKDKSSFGNNQMQISNDLQNYINSLVEEVVLNNKDFATQKKYIIRYAEAESIDSKKLLESLEAFLILVDKYKKNKSEELKNNLEKQASKCYIEVGVIKSITNSSKPREKETTEKKEEPRIKQEKKKPTKWIITAIVAVFLILITIMLIANYMSVIKEEQKIAQGIQLITEKAQATEETETPKRSPAAQKVFESIKWVPIDAGSFMMGSPESEVGRHINEKQHKVTLSAFKMSAHCITFDQYDVFCEATDRHSPKDEGWGRGKRPVINVSWEDAVAFADWLGGGVRLPTEAEWEYACRAGTKTPFNTGANLTTEQANYHGDYPYNNNAKGDYRGKTVPVGSFAPNAWGLYDMHGNVWEWCNDWYDKDYYSKDAAKDPKGPSSGSIRVLRGGSWYYYAQLCRSANRNYYSPTYRYSNIGFRLVCPQ